MKHIYYIFLLALIFIIPANAKAQDCSIYDGYREGTSIRTVMYDAKDKITGFSITSVKEKSDIPGGIRYLFHQKYNDTEEIIFENDVEMTCINGELHVDMSTFFDPSSMSAYEDMEFDVSADDLTIPKNAAPGDRLDDGTVTMVINTGTPMKVTLSVSLSNRIVEGRETVNTPAGNFDCLKIRYDILTQVGFVKVKGSSVEYYDGRHGVVRTESYNKKGKLTGYSLVEEINE